MKRPDVVVLSTGGTIAGSGASKMSLAEYKAGALLGRQLVEAVPEIEQFANVRVEQVCNVASPTSPAQCGGRSPSESTRSFAKSPACRVW